MVRLCTALRALRRPGVWSRLPPEGLESLRAWFAAKAGGAYAAHEVTICPGTRAALAAAFRAFQSGGPVLLENPTYPGTILVCDADPGSVVRAVLRFVEQNDREILDRDAALATLVRQELFTADAVTPRPRAR